MRGSGKAGWFLTRSAEPALGKMIAIMSKGADILAGLGYSTLGDGSGKDTGCVK